ncbi:MAG: Cof-type HAD-IIB family hydrolase [Chthoniobacterales bacterium]
MKPLPKPTKFSLMLADVDGALVTNDKLVTPRARAAVAALRAAGIGFTITSGRPPRGMKMLIDDLKIDTIIAGFNGGVFVNPDLSVIQSRFISRAAAVRALEVIDQHKLVGWLYTATDWFVPDPQGAHVAREAWTVKFEAKVSTDFSSLLDGAVKIVGVSDDLDAVARCEAALQAELRGQASAARSQPYYLDVTNPEANKGGVVDFLSRSLGIPAEGIATIGDMPNDVLMFEKSGLSIAMGNASPQVQAQANFVTLSNEEDGFAHAMEKFVLPRATSASN